VTFAKEFFIGHEGTSTTIYETSKIFNAVLDEPKRYGFKDSISSCPEADCPWVDGFHPSSEFHTYLAADLAMFLNSI
jgi:phospholipase/lecithinase/hemolysin